MRLSASLCVLAPALLICLELHQAHSARDHVRKKRFLDCFRHYPSISTTNNNHGNSNGSISNVHDASGQVIYYGRRSVRSGGDGDFSGSGSRAAVNANSFDISEATSNSASLSHGLLKKKRFLGWFGHYPSISTTNNNHGNSNGSISNVHDASGQVIYYGRRSVRSGGDGDFSGSGSRAAVNANSFDISEATSNSASLSHGLLRKKRTLGLLHKILHPNHCGGPCSSSNYHNGAINGGFTGPLDLFKFNFGASHSHGGAAAQGGGGGFPGSGSSAAANTNSFGGGGGGFSNSQASSNSASQSHGFGGGSSAQASSQAQSGAYTNDHNQGFNGAFVPQPPYYPNPNNQFGCGYGGCGFGPGRFNNGGGFGGVQSGVSSNAASQAGFYHG